MSPKPQQSEGTDSTKVLGNTDKPKMDLFERKWADGLQISLRTQRPPASTGSIAIFDPLGTPYLVQDEAPACSVEHLFQDDAPIADKPSGGKPDKSTMTGTLLET
ncbi:uncharacterized protein SPSK_02063 [Sporothrix schenckii 1099-18]|uniref:Uncharacterized protein n=2 Tax=Sporothrix schenckii TaxID=29908 RepID=U7PHV9_SPOS1|nr:uncharacterized protein SPSK_02063 [Sporothrix schenckii 1099-18]ERS95117.1 hypothetical protein HMPREF1624_08609 [Sporothrix schenckii ATCC 58251]KJR87263.1 hypothetical protein SPSK_02063 [Sporothrix schenckii 1099-18]